MKQLISAVTKALENENWYAALYLALTLPDVCGNIQHPELKTEKRYVQWFDEYLSDKYIHEVGANREKLTFLSAEDCYALRCSLLHEGIDVISHQRCKKGLDSFRFTTTGSHCNYIDIGGKPLLQLDVGRFCNDVCDSVEVWLSDVANDSTAQERLSQIVTIDRIRF